MQAVTGLALPPLLLAPRRCWPARQRPQRPATIGEQRYDQHAAAMAFADDLAQRRGWDPAWVREQIGQARHLPRWSGWSRQRPGRHAQELGRLPRPIHRAPCVCRRACASGRTHRHALARAEAEFGVPASLIVGVIGVETLYGQHTGALPGASMP
jgi:membrane-bound lytic murein transglycosylase B